MHALSALLVALSLIFASAILAREAGHLAHPLAAALRVR